MTPTPEQVAAWAREAGIPDVVQATNPPAFERFAALACAWQAEQDAKLCELQAELAKTSNGAARAYFCATTIRASVK